MTYKRPGVYVNETSTSVPVLPAGSANAAAVALGAFAQGPSTPTLVTSWYDFVKKFGPMSAKYPATIGVNQFFLNGGTELYVCRVLSSDAAQAYVNLPAATSGNVGRVYAKNFGSQGANLRVQVTSTGVTNYYNLYVYEEIVAAEIDTNATNDILVEQFLNVSFGNTASSSDFVQTVVNNSSNYIEIRGTDGVITTSIDTTKLPQTQNIDGVLPLTGSNLDGVSAPVAANYTAVVTTNGTSPLDSIDRPLIVFAPELYAKFVVDGNSGAAADLLTVQNAMIAWANTGYGFAVVDTAPSLSVNDAVSAAAARTASAQAAVYYPHYYIVDPLGRNGQGLRKVAPASAVVGLYLATDKTVGPWKTPAGINSKVVGAISLERSFTPTDLDTLNAASTPVNAVRNLPGAGVVVMGGKTLKQDGTANRYINTRRSLIYLKKQLQDITTFAVFENNDYKLWNRLTTVVSVFLNEYRNQGGLRGEFPSDAYYVKCDAENNTPSSIALGQVNIEVGVALEYPAEFIVINLSQITGN